MATNDKASSAAILLKLEAKLEKRLPGPRARQVIEFARHYFVTAAAEDMAHWRLDDLYGATLSSWEFLQEYSLSQPKVRVYNPEFEEHGWQSSHTIVQVLSEDLPFTLDSLRVELNRRNLGIHALHNAVITLKRDSRNHFAGFLSSNSKAKSARHETLLSIEIDRHADPRLLQDLEQALNDVLYQVAMVVEDFQPMQGKTEQLVAMYDAIPPAKRPDGMAETRAFIGWLQQHFTFLGYDEYALTSSRSKQLQPLAGSQLGVLKYCDDYCRDELINDEQRDLGQFTLIPDLLSFTKSPSKSRVHRPAYPDYINIKRFNKQGKVIGESRFLGLYTSEVYLGNARQIPVVREKVDAVLARSGRHKFSHDWKELLQILEIHPRDDLFQASVDELYDTVIGILQIHERRQIRLFLRRDPFGRYVSCLVYAPRDIYSTEFRLKVEHLLLTELDCSNAEFNTYFSESILARTHFVLRSDRIISEQIDVSVLQSKVQSAAKSWTDELYDALIDTLGEEQGIVAFNRYGRGFPASYRDDFSARTAVVDIQHIEDLDKDNNLSLSFYRTLEKHHSGFNFKLFNLGNPLPLSDILPILENLGLRVIDEHPYALDSAGNHAWIHDFNLTGAMTEDVDIQQIKQVFQSAFMEIWKGNAANDEFNRLVLSAGLSWRQISLLRAYAAYMKQIRFPIGESAVCTILNNHSDIAGLMLQLFDARFNPDYSVKQREKQQQQKKNQIVTALEQVENLNDDKVLRQFLTLIQATQRSNYYQRLPSGERKSYIALKLLPDLIPEMSEPKPRFEVFVISPQLQGVHMRAGHVARGGVRWSEREEDFRTEVLGLMKAQQVTNAVIVPVGAKGGFVAKRLGGITRGDLIQAEVTACYRVYISALLDVTDNLVKGEVVAADDVVRHDEDDTYLVVAADKGTVAFSDIANDIARECGYWLGDGFASGGSQGYDHRRIGITAKGAWVSVERHFRELGVNVATTDFSVIGIGDMSGDVFGNGMLRSRHICLQGGFNHQHIFIDPTPDPALSWTERKRLFELPDSSWNEYDKTLISKGGGIFSRSAKSIAISPEMNRAFDINEAKLTPNELISCLLQAPVDLLWNGGIGTFVKASEETNIDVGDKVNDAIRINASKLRCRIIGEGGNLGVTQQARVEYALCFGRVNCDFIDNAGGVDCSDHEVNIKILLNEVVAAGDMTVKQRNRLLLDMTEDVTTQVLKNNYRQVQAISLEQMRAVDAMAENRRFINVLEADSVLDRGLEFIPTDEQLAERQVRGVGLTRPELSVLLAYSKGVLKQSLLRSGVPDDPYLNKEMRSAFPERLVASFPEVMMKHRLQREIVATQLANNMVNLMGFKFVDRLKNSTRAGIDRIARAYVLAREVFDMEGLWLQIEALDYKVDATIQLVMMDELQYLIRRATRWFIANRTAESLDYERELVLFRETIGKVGSELGSLLCGQPKMDWHEAYERYTDAHVPQELATVIAGTRSLYSVLNIIEVAADNAVPVDRAASVMFEMGEQLQLYWLIQSLNQLERDSHWQALARESFRDDIDLQQRKIVSTMLHNSAADGVEDCMRLWCEQNSDGLQRWLRVINDLIASERKDYAMFTVAISELSELTRD